MSVPRSTKNQRRFFYHYNKPLSRVEGRNVLTVHWKGSCHAVNDIECWVPAETHTQKDQPRCIIRGWATAVQFHTNPNTRKITAVIT
jgi:hypothetical protein